MNKTEFADKVAGIIVGQGEVPVEEGFDRILSALNKLAYAGYSIIKMLETETEDLPSPTPKAEKIPADNPCKKCDRPPADCPGADACTWVVAAGQ